MSDYAKILFKAYADRKPCVCFSEQGIQISEDESYIIQNEVLALREKQLGEKHLGYKIGLTTFKTQELYKTDHPFYGMFTDKNVVEDKLELSNLMQGFVLEMELAFLVTEDFSNDASEDEVYAKTIIAPAIEIPDGRYVDWAKNTDLNWIRADMGVSGAITIGKGIAHKGADFLKDMSATLYFNGEEIASGTGENLLGHPMIPMMWLVKTLEKEGRPLKKGMFVSAGSVTFPKPIEKGTYRVELLGVGNLELEIV